MEIGEIRTHVRPGNLFNEQPVSSPMLKEDHHLQVRDAKMLHIPRVARPLQ